MSRPLPEIKLKTMEELFGITNEDSSQEGEEKVIEVPISELHTFKNHPFSVKDDDKMQETVDSIKERGVLVPGIVRKREDGGYELISGHRRRRACELAGLKTMPVFVRNLTDDEATIVMVDSNIQREEILPSEKAKAYKMKYEALKHQGKSGTGQSLELMAKEAGESRATIQRYVTVADMEPELLEMMDEKKLGLTQAVDLASLKKEEQQEVSKVFQKTSSVPSKAQTSKIKQLSKEEKFDKDSVEEIIQNKKEREQCKEETVNPIEKKQQSRRVAFAENELSRYFSDDFSEEQIKDVIKELLEKWKSKN